MLMWSLLISKWREIKKEHSNAYYFFSRFSFTTILALILVLVITIPNVSPVSAYDVKVNNAVDADSDIDVVANIGTNNSDYTNAQIKDGVYQNITEVDQGTVAANYDDAFDNNVTDTQTPSDVGTYSSSSSMQVLDIINNTLTEAQGAGQAAQVNITHLYNQSNTDIDSYPDVGIETDPTYANDSSSPNANNMTLQEVNQGAASGGQLNSTKDTVVSDTTTSATYEDVNGLTAFLTFSYTSDVLLFASVQVTGSTAAKGGWRLVFDGTNYLDLERQIGTEPGNVMLVDLVTAKTAGTYIFKVQHQTDTGTLTTANAIIVAVALHNGDGAVPASSAYVASDTVGNAWVDITGLTTEITLSSTSHIVAIMVMNGYHSGNNKDTDFAINIDATRMEVHDRDWSASSEYGVVSVSTRTDSTKTAGTYTVKGEWKGSGGSTMTGEDFKLVVIAAEANSGANSIDVQKDVVASDTTVATSIENITGSLVTASVVDNSHILAIMTTSTDVTVASTSAYTTINIGGTDYDVMERGHPSATRWGSIGQVVRTDSTVSTDQEVYGRWYTDSTNTLTGGSIVLISIVLYAGTPGSADYEVDFEYSFTSPDNDNTYETVCFYVETASQNGENLVAYEWDGSWQSLGTLNSDTWNNFTLSYLDGAPTNYYIRLIDSDQAAEATQSTWKINTIFLSTSNDAIDDYEFDRQFNFENLNSSDDFEEVTIYTGDTMSDTEDLDIFVWDGSWNDIGDILNTQTDQWVNISIATYLTTSDLAFSFRDKDQTTEGTQSTWEINYVGVHTWNTSVLDYELQWEHQAQSVDPNKDSYNLTIYGYDDPVVHYPSEYFEFVELNEKRGQTYRHWLNESSQTYRYSSAYLVNKTGVVDNTDWVTVSEYPNKYILRTTDGSIYRTSSVDEMNNIYIAGAKEQLWAVGVETYAGVFGIYMNFQDIDWGHGQYLYWPRLRNGQISLFSQPLYGIYSHLYANYLGTWYNKILNDRSLYDLPSKNPRNTIVAFNNSDEIGFSFTTNDLTIFSSNWDFTHGFKFNKTDQLYHMITRMKCNDRDFLDVGMAYEITSSPQSDGTPYQPNRFLISNDTNSVVVDISQNWNASDYLLNYFSRIEIISQNNESFSFTFTDMENAGFINKYLGTHDQQFPNGSVRKVLRVGMYGYGSYSQGNWISIDPIFSEKQTTDAYDMASWWDGASTWSASTTGNRMAIGESQVGDTFRASFAFDTNIAVNISAISDITMSLMTETEVLEAGEYVGLGVYDKGDANEIWDETEADADAQGHWEQSMYYSNNSFYYFSGDEYNSSIGNADMRQYLDQWLTHHNGDPAGREFIAFKIYEGTGIDPGEDDYINIYESSEATANRRPTLTFSYYIGELIPIGVGTFTGLTPNGESNNWECVDDAVIDEDTTYVSRGLGTSNDTYETSNASDPSGTIDNVTVFTRSLWSGLGGGWVRSIVYTYSTSYEGTQDVLVEDTYTNFSYTWTTNPFTSSAWTWQEIDDLEIGVELQAGASTTVRCTRVWATVGVTVGGNSENWAVQIWNATDTSWDYLDINNNITASEQWYNYTLAKADHLDGSNQITWRYIGTDEEGDSQQDILHIDYSGVAYWNFTVNIIETYLTISGNYSQGSGWVAYEQSPIEINVSIGETYTVQIKGTDGALSPIANEYLRFHTSDDPGSGTNLSLSWQNLYVDQSKGEVQHLCYFWVAVPFGVNDDDYTFTLEIRVIKS